MKNKIITICWIILMILCTAGIVCSAGGRQFKFVGAWFYCLTGGLLLLKIFAKKQTTVFKIVLYFLMAFTFFLGTMIFSSVIHG